jgi:hypothetical protein
MYKVCLNQCKRRGKLKFSLHSTLSKSFHRPPAVEWHVDGWAISHILPKCIIQSRLGYPLLVRHYTNYSRRFIPAACEFNYTIRTIIIANRINNFEA